MKRQGKGHRLLAILLSAVLLVSVMPFGAITADAATTEFAGGSGTQADPYLIETSEHLYNVRNHLSAHYKLTAQIYAGGWTPIGTSGAPFNGMLDGNGYAIVGLSVYSNGSYAAGGLFGYIGTKGVVKNLGMINGKIDTKEYVGDDRAFKTLYAGAIAGYNKGTIENCYNTGTVTVYIGTISEYLDEKKTVTCYAKAGGIVGENAGTITRCYNTGKISCVANNSVQLGYYYSGGPYTIAAETYGGGIVGYSDKGTVTSSFNRGEVIANAISQSAVGTHTCTATTRSYAGGIAGEGYVHRCYNDGTVQSDSRAYILGSSSRIQKTNSFANAGGIAGFSYGVGNCYNIGSVTADSICSCGSTESAKQYAFAGGIVGRGAPERCYSTETGGASRVTTSGLSKGDAIVAMHTGLLSSTSSPTKEHCYSYQYPYYDDLSDPTTYVGFDFDTVWEMDPSASYRYPMLRGLPTEVGDILNFAGGIGTEGNPYKIATKEHLHNVRNDLSAHYVMVDDVVFTEMDFTKDGKFYNGGTGWRPIGSSDAPFTGYFDANDHAVIGLTANVAATDEEAYLGLFGYLDGGCIRRLRMVDGNLQLHGTDVSYCGLGGIVGYMVDGSVAYCSNDGSVVLTNSGYHSAVGGIVGCVADGTVANCYNVGSVESTDDSSCSSGGGVVGYISGGTVTNCYNVGSVTVHNQKTNAYSGGIAGFVRTEGTATVSITSCYNKGAVCSDKINYGGYAVAGGIVGNLEEVGKSSVWITAVYNTGEIAAGSRVETVPSVGGTTVYSVAGGIVGQTIGGSVRNGYNMGKVRSASQSALSDFLTSAWSGGIAGSGNTLSIAGCYNVGAVLADAASSVKIGGICGYGSSTSTVTQSFYADSVAEGATKMDTDNSQKCTLAAMKKQSTYAGFDFTTVWTMAGNADYPYPELQDLAMDYTKSVQHIEVASAPDKLRFVEGMALDVSGGQILAYYDNDTTQYIDITTDMVSGYDSTCLGVQIVTVTYGGKTATYEVEVILRRVLSIEISKLPEQLAYLEGIHALSVNGGQITVFYEGDVCEVKDLTADLVIGFDNAAVGEQTLTVNFEGKTDTYTVEIVARQLQSITVSRLPDTLEYLECWDALNVEGGQIAAYYNGGFVVVYDMLPSMVSAFDNRIVGRQELTVTFEDKTAKYEVEILAKSFVSIAVTTKPLVLEYLEGKNFSADGMVVTAYYNNNTSAEIFDYTVSGYDSTPGTKTITVAYLDQQASFAVEVMAKSLVNIAVTTKPSKLTYLEAKDRLDVTDGKVTLYYNNDTSEVINLTTGMVSGFDNTQVGKQTITVTYRGFTDTFEVEIIKKSLTSIAVTTKPAKLTYLEAKDALDCTDGTVTLYYDNGTKTVINLTADMVSDFDNTRVGEQTLTVTYGGLTDTFNVEVIAKTLVDIAVTTTPAKLTYLEAKEMLDVTGGKVTLYYDNDTVEVIDLTDEMVSGLSNEVVGTHTITVIYEGFCDTFEVEVIAKSLASMKIVLLPYKLTYVEGEAFDKSGMYVMAYYDNDTTSRIRDYVVSGYDSTPGTKTITISYGGLSETFTVVVNCGEFFTNACDSDCNLCGATRTVGDHEYDNACDTDCNICGDTRTVGDHVYDHACDTNCNICGDTRAVSDHVYDHDCDTDCNVCEESREVGDHVYDHACDTDCNVCGAIRSVGDHVYDHDCDTDCNVCGAIRSVGDHVYDHACDTDCNICSDIRAVGDHVYDHACDADCNICGENRIVDDHVYDNACDAACNICEDIRTVGDHVYDHACDTTCNVCEVIRTITHAYKTTTTEATLTKNGSIVKKCAVCGKVASTTKLYYPKTFTLSTTSYTYNGAVRTPSVTVKDAAGKTLKKNTDYTVTYASGRKNIGKYAVKVTFKGKYSGSKTMYFTINPKIKLSATSYTYNGKVKTPSVTVTNAAGTKLSTKYYSVSYSSGRKNVGTYKVTVKFKNGHSGSYSYTYKINPKIKLSATSYTYDGKVKTPSVTVTNAAGTKLSTKYYTVSYSSGRKNVGTYKVTVKFKNGHSGSYSYTYKINPPKTTVSKLTAGSKSIKVAITKKSTQVTGYQIQYSTSKTFSSAKTATVSSYKTTSVTLKSLSAKKTYYVRVRTYKTVNGTKYYSGWSTYKYVKTK